MFDELLVFTHKSSNEHVPCVCVYHVGQKHVSDSPGITGECIARMAFERARYQADVIAGDGNKACYLATPKAGGVPTYECSLLQYWINKMMNVATQSRRKHFGDCPPVRVKHFISCSYRDLDFLATHLDGITTATSPQNSRRRQKIVVIAVCYLSLSGDMLDWSMRKISVVFMIKITWIFIGEFTFRVNETCLITTSSWWHLQTETLTTLFLFT